MSYYIAKTLSVSFNEAVARTTFALKEQGFGVLTDIDVAATMKAKLDADIRAYRILGACNPKLAFEALKLEDKVGTMLPCNVVVQELASGKVEVAAVDPVASMAAIDNPELKDKAGKVRVLLERVIDALLARTRSPYWLDASNTVITTVIGGLSEACAISDRRWSFDAMTKPRDLSVLASVSASTSSI